MYFSFHQKWSKLGTLLQSDAKKAEMKKKNKILTMRFVKDIALTVYFDDQEMN
jgi:hypothetical protein